MAVTALSPQAATSCAYKPTVVLMPSTHTYAVTHTSTRPPVPRLWQWRVNFQFQFPRTVVAVGAALPKGPCKWSVLCRIFRNFYFIFFLILVAFNFTQQLQFCVALEVFTLAAATLLASLVWTDLAVGDTACHFSA